MDLQNSWFTPPDDDEEEGPDERDEPEDEEDFDCECAYEPRNLQ